MAGFGHYPLRGSSTERGYGSRWQKFQAAFLAKNPLCGDCQKRGLTTAASVVDHIIPHRGDMEIFWREGNHQSLCEPCHNVHKQRLEKSGRVVGCTADGMPLDESHRWNNGRQAAQTSSD